MSSRWCKNIRTVGDPRTVLLTDYDLQTVAYSVSMWSMIGSAKNVGMVFTIFWQFITVLWLFLLGITLNPALYFGGTHTGSIIVTVIYCIAGYLPTLLVIYILRQRSMQSLKILGYTTLVFTLLLMYLSLAIGQLNCVSGCPTTVLSEPEALGLIVVLGLALLLFLRFTFLLISGRKAEPRT